MLATQTAACESHAESEICTFTSMGGTISGICGYGPGSVEMYCRAL